MTKLFAFSENKKDGSETYQTIKLIDANLFADILIWIFSNIHNFGEETFHFMHEFSQNNYFEV